MLLKCEFLFSGVSAGEIAEDDALSPVAMEAPEEVAEVVGDAPVAGTDTVEGELELEGATIHYWLNQDEDEFVLVLQTTITDITVPYDLEVVTGSRFAVPDPPVTPHAAVQTLIFVSYPYVRETVSNITTRSPYAPFEMPPLIRLPHPKILDETAAVDPGPAANSE